VSVHQNTATVANSNTADRAVYVEKQNGDGNIKHHVLFKPIISHFNTKQAVRLGRHHNMPPPHLDF